MLVSLSQATAGTGSVIVFHTTATCVSLASYVGCFLADRHQIIHTITVTMWSPTFDVPSVTLQLSTIKKLEQTSSKLQISIMESWIRCIPSVSKQTDHGNAHYLACHHGLAFQHLHCQHSKCIPNLSSCLTCVESQMPHYSEKSTKDVHARTVVSKAELNIRLYHHNLASITITSGCVKSQNCTSVRMIA